MKKYLLILTLPLALGTATVAVASEHEHAGHIQSHEQSAMHHANGVVKAIKAGKIQISHEPVPELQWPAMTMWFEIDQMPSDIKVGDQVSFGMQPSGKNWKVGSIERR